jgi:hypothetical protein
MSPGSQFRVIAAHVLAPAVTVVARFQVVPASAGFVWRSA